MIHDATRSWSGQPEFDAGVPKEWPRDVRYIDGTRDDSGRIWFRDPHELLYPPTRDMLRNNINRAIGTRRHGEILVLDLECGEGFPSPSWGVARLFHGLDHVVWMDTINAIAPGMSHEAAYESASVAFLPPAVDVLDDFPHRHDGYGVLGFAGSYIDHAWWRFARAVNINFYLQHPGQDPAYVALGRKSMAHVAHRCAARRDVKVYATVCAQYEHGPGEYVKQDEWKATMDACAEHGVEPILWGRWKDKDAADAMRRFLESGGIKAVEAAGLTKTGGGVI